MKTVIRLLMLFRPYWGWALLGILVSLISLLANIVLLSLSGWFITMMGLAGVTGVAVNYFTPAAIIRACAILRTGGRYAERLVTHEATFRFMAEMRVWLYRQIEAMSLRRSSQWRSGDLLARLRGDIDALETFYINVVTPLCVAVPAVLIVTAVFAWFSPVLALSELLLLCVAGIAIPVATYNAGKYWNRQITEQRSALKIAMVDNVQAMAEMVVYGLEPDRYESALQQSDDIIIRQRRLGEIDATAQAFGLLVTNLGMGLALVLAVSLYQNQAVTAPHVPMLVLMALASFEAVMPLSLALQSLPAVLQAAERIFSLEQPMTVSPENNLPVPAIIEVRMENVTFAYPGRPVVLKDYSLQLRSGHVHWLKGPSGMGKTSIIHLLTRFYEPESGHLTLNGRNYDDYSEDELRRYFAVVPQHPYIFTGTIRTNLLLADPHATQASLDAACHIACLTEMIERLPDGYDTYVGEGGATLSGGEIRRLAVARAVLKNAPCLLLDEPTEGLDAATAEQLRHRLLAYAAERAVLYITHDDAIL